MNGNNTSPRIKRKAPPSPEGLRPHKQHRALNGKLSAGDNTPRSSSNMVLSSRRKSPISRTPQD
ncbi:pro-apoptotic serine protease NMA111 [Colletotrichum tofieldiae]|nr:pro-apoptotic serine protease NMA111 [Colletotrichum tofieldiae]